jgi:hypothetical protein
MSEIGAVNHYRERHRDALNHFTVKADEVYEYTGLSVCDVCGFPQLGYDDDKWCGGAGGIPPLTGLDELPSEVDSDSGAQVDETDRHPLRWFSPEHIAEYLSVAPVLETLLDPCVQTTTEPRYEANLMARVKRVWMGLLACQLDTTMSDTNVFNAFLMFLIMPAILYRSDPAMTKAKGALTRLLNARAAAFLSGDAGGLIKEMVEDVQRMRVSRAERDASTQASAVSTPARLKTMVVQGRYREVTAVFVAQRATQGVVSRAPLQDDECLAAQTLRGSNKEDVDETPNVWDDGKRVPLQAILQAFAGQGGVSSDDVFRALSEMRRGRGGGRGGMKQEHLRDFVAGCPSTTQLLAQWITRVVTQGVEGTPISNPTMVRIRAIVCASAGLCLTKIGKSSLRPIWPDMPLYKLITRAVLGQAKARMQRILAATNTALEKDGGTAIAMTVQLIQSVSESVSTQKLISSDARGERMTITLAMDVKAMYTETGLGVATESLLSEHGLNGLIVSFLLRYGSAREGIIHYDAGGSTSFPVRSGMNIGDYVSQLVACLVLGKGIAGASKGVQWDDCHMCAYADNVYITGPCARALMLSRKIRSHLQDTYIFDDVQVLRVCTCELTSDKVQDREVRRLWDRRLRNTVENVVKRQLSGSTLSEELQWLASAEWTTNGITIIGHPVGTDDFRRDRLIQVARDSAADIKAMQASGLAGTAQFTMLWKSLQFRLSHHWKAHPERICAPAARIADRGIVQWFESMLPHMESPALGAVEGGIGGLRESIIFMHERVGGWGFTRAQNTVWGGAYIAGLRTALIHLDSMGARARYWVRQINEFIASQSPIGKDVSQIGAAFYMRRRQLGDTKVQRWRNAVPQTNRELCRVSATSRRTWAALKGTLDDVRRRAWQVQMARRIRPCPSPAQAGGSDAGRPTSLENQKYHPTAKLWAGIRARSMVLHPFRALKAPLLEGDAEVSDEAMQFMLCQVFVWRTPLVAKLDYVRCACGYDITDDHFLGCVATGSSHVHDLVVAAVVALVHTFGSTHAVSLISSEPTGCEAGYTEEDRKGPDIRLDGLKGRAVAQVVDVTGVNPVATKGWTAFLGGHSKVFPDKSRTGLHPLERAAHRKRMSADAKAAEAARCEYLPAVFLRTGGLHPTFRKFLQPLFPMGLNDTVLAPRYGRQTLFDVIVDKIAKCVANGNYAVLQANIGVAERRQAKSTERVSALVQAQAITVSPGCGRSRRKKQRRHRGDQRGATVTAVVPRVTVQSTTGDGEQANDDHDYHDDEDDDYNGAPLPSKGPGRGEAADDDAGDEAVRAAVATEEVANGEAGGAGGNGEATDSAEVRAGSANAAAMGAKDESDDEEAGWAVARKDEAAEDEGDSTDSADYDSARSTFDEEPGDDTSVAIELRRGHELGAHTQGYREWQGGRTGLMSSEARRSTAGRDTMDIDNTK